MDRVQRLAVTACSVALALAGSSALAQSTPKYTNAEVVEVRTLERLLVIKNTEGGEQTLQLDDHVEGIGELRPGDRVILTLRGEPGRARVQSFTKSKAAQTGTASQQPAQRAVVDDTGEETRAGDAFEARVAAAAQLSLRVDSLWTIFRTSCNVLLRGAAYDGARQWLSLWDRTAQADLSSGNCRDMHNEIVGLGQAVNEAMADAEDVARRVLSPGRIREIERRHSLEWGGWGRSAPELRDHP